MCTLYKMRSSVAEVAHMFGRFQGDRVNLPPFEEIFPGYEAPILRHRDGELALELMRWGVPPPPRAGTRPIVNIRNLDSPWWRAMLNDPAHHCLVPVTSFCEWTGEKGHKRKVWFSMADPLALPFAFAGLWRRTGEGPRMAFLTCAPNALVGAIHPQAMPVILPPAAYRLWLAGDHATAVELARPYPDAEMAIVPEG
jgi:putative SOS response-associated peptidase YedK